MLTSNIFMGGFMLDALLVSILIGLAFACLELL